MATFHILVPQGHGEYIELPEEKSFFDVAKKSNNMICHFYREATFRCKIVDKHLKLLAPKHVEAMFCKIDAEKCPFLTGEFKSKGDYKTMLNALV